MSDTNLLTLKEVASLLRLSPQTVYKLLKEERIPAIKLGSQWRFHRDRIEAWLRGETGAA